MSTSARQTWPVTSPPEPDDDRPYCARSCGRVGLYSITTGVISVQIDDDPFCEVAELVCDPEGCP